MVISFITLLEGCAHSFGVECKKSKSDSDKKNRSKRKIKALLEGCAHSLGAECKGKQKHDQSSCLNTDRECPICFRHYPQINRLQCCKATICTKCFLKIQELPGSKQAACPFCCSPKMKVHNLAQESDEDVEEYVDKSNGQEHEEHLENINCSRLFRHQFL